MAINTLVTIQDSITAFAVGHGQLQGRVIFESDDHRSAYITEENTYPLLFVAPIDVSVNRAMNVHTLRFYVYERINDDRLDVWENANDTSLILRDIRLWWNDYGIEDIEIKEDFVGQFGCDKELDNLVGYFADIRFEIPSHGRCQVPVDVTPSTTPTCSPATQIITDTDGNELYNNSIPSGLTETQIIQDSVVTLTDSALNVLSTSNVLAESTLDLVAPDAVINFQNEDGTPLATVNYPSGSNTDAPLSNNTASNSDNTFTAIEPFANNIDLPDITVTDSDGSTYTQPSVTDVFCTPSPDTTIEVNGVVEGTVVAGSTVDIQLSDSGGVVVPDSVTVVGNDFQIVLADAVAVPSVGATLMQTGQTTVYRTGDDADKRLTSGRATSFFVLAVNNPFGNTNRFTDELGGQTYTNNIVIDWSTYDNVAGTVLGYKRTLQSIITWANAIDSCLAVSIGIFTTGWRMTNIHELSNLFSFSATYDRRIKYAPFNLTDNFNYWVSTTYPLNSGFAYRTLISVGDWNVYDKTNSAYSMACRTFTVTGTTLT